MNKQYLTDYIIENNIKLKHNELNMINTPCGSGKTTFIFSKKGIIFNYNQFTDDEYDIRNDEALYITDTSMLKDKTLSKYSSITKKFITKNFYEEVLKDGITVMTYKQVGDILNSSFKSDFISTYKIIIMDEFHNLFNYNNKFTNTEYRTVIKNLNLLSRKTLLLCLTATPYYVDKWNKNIGLIENNVIDKVDNLVSYMEEIICKETYTVNYIKSQLLFKKCLEHDRKILIYTRNISVMKKYKKICGLYGFKAECLWSVNSTKEKLNKYQENLRERLIDIGTLPDDLDVLIINAAYETGWDLVDEKVQIVIVDDTNITTQQQARNRCRHNIHKLVVKMKKITKTIYGDMCESIHSFDSQEIKNNKNWFFDYIKYDSDMSLVDFTRLPMLMNNIDEKYINKKLTAKDKEELTLMYAYNLGYKEIKYTHFCKQLNNISEKYKIITTNKGSYIRNKDYVQKNMEKLRKEKNMDTVENWLLNDWDKVRIPVNEVRDILDLGRKSYEKIVKDTEFIEWLNKNNIEMTKIKGLGRTVYFNSL